MRAVCHGRRKDWNEIDFSKWLQCNSGYWPHELVHETFLKLQSFAWQLPVGASWNQKYSVEIDKLWSECFIWALQTVLGVLQCFRCTSICWPPDDSLFLFKIRFSEEESFTFDVCKHLWLAEQWVTRTAFLMNKYFLGLQLLEYFGNALFCRIS